MNLYNLDLIQILIHKICITKRNKRIIFTFYVIRLLKIMTVSIFILSNGINFAILKNKNKNEKQDFSECQISYS